MLLGLVDLFERLGAAVEHQELSDMPRNSVLSIDLDDVRVRFAVETRVRAPYPGELARMQDQHEQLSNAGSPLLLAPYISESAGHALTASQWSWVDGDGNADVRAEGIRIHRRITTSPPKVKKSNLPSGSASWAIIRLLTADGEAAGASATAVLAGVSQPRASQVLAHLTEAGMVERENRSLWRADRAALLDAFLSEYSGPGGEARWLYSLDPPVAVARAAVDLHKERQPVLVSGDVAADWLAPWRTPTHVTLYSTNELDEERLGVVPAHGADDGNIELIVPADGSVFQDQSLTELPVAHPSQVIWDLMRLGGSDRSEAAERVRAWLLAQ